MTLVPIDPDDEVTEAEVICGQTEASCHCILDPGHIEPHRCECGGQWRGDGDGDDFEYVADPGSNPAWIGPRLPWLL
jgi:hypothetical protein